MRRILIPFFIIFFLSLKVFSQKESYFKRVFVDAEYYLLYEEYRDALPLYLEILRSYPNNSNISYRIGQCYLNLVGEKNKSLSYFEKAILNVTDRYKEGYFSENKAPREVFIDYGKALRINNEFDKALQSFVTYKSMLVSGDKREMVIVDKEIESIANAKFMTENPKNHIFTQIGRNVSTRFSEINPVSNSSGNILVYTSLQRFYNAILFSELIDSVWVNPLNLNTQLFADGPISTVGISGNGSFLVLSRNDNDDYNLYLSNFDKNKKTWAPLTKLPKEINARNWETYGSLSKNGDTLYFSSNRETGFGGFDIYMSTKSIEGLWSNPVNLGLDINTAHDESTPFITHDGKKLFFCSRGHSTMGGYDLFVSKLEEGKWTKPINLGYPLNTTDDDTFFFPIGDGKKGFIARTLPNGMGETDIFMITLDF
ncbi:MAG: hypothetical protein AB9846_16625 [Tenuifilaceae bacterium]